MASQDESFPLESNQSNESQDNQRTSTPTKDFVHSQSDFTRQFSAAPNVALSPVQKTFVNALYQDSSKLPDSSLSTGGVSVDETKEDSASVYTSALSNVDLTVTSDSYVTLQEAVDSKVLSGSHVTLNSEGLLACSQIDISLPHETCLQNKTSVECSTENGMWNMAVESIQDSSDLKDKTFGQELSVSNVSSNVGCTSFSTNGDRRESGYEEVLSTIENDQDPQHILDNGLLHNAKNPDNIPMEGHSPDLELLNEICEEATNMTIKEALISSLDPGVRAGLCEGRLSLNESEILALEQYCEKFIDNLLSQLLDVNWSKRISEEAHKKQKFKDKTIITQKLSQVGLEKLKSNCDRFVHSIITESLHDTCYGFLNDKELIKDVRDLSSKENENGQLNEDNFEALLPLFKESKAIQDYVGFLSADVIKSALTNLSTSIATLNAKKNEEVTLNEKTVLDNSTEENHFPFHDTEMWKYQGDSVSGSLEHKTYVELMTVDTNVRDKGGLSDDECMLSSGLPGALETSLEYDTGEWEGDGLFEEFRSLDTDGKQKIMLRELSFDDHADVAGTELLAPVFLAIAEENDDDTEIQGMRKRTLSIEDLCGVINEPGKEKSRPRSQSATKRLIKEEYETCESNFIPEEDSTERYSDSEEDYEGDEEEVDDDYMDNGEGTIEQEGEINGDNEQGHLHNKMTSEVNSDARFRWHTVSVNGREKVLDLKLLEPYMKVISHGGYFSDTRSTIIVIAACYLPDRGLSNYDYLMEQLFFYIISTMELLAVHEEYYLVYLNGGTRQHNMPYVAWMKRFYQLIEGGLKKRMREMFIVHANFRLKVIITLAKPFLNAIFWRKLIFVHSLGSLSSHIPVDYIYIPDEVMKVDPAYRRVHNG